MKIPWSKRWRLNRELVKTSTKLKPYVELLYHLSNALILVRKLTPEHGNKITDILTDIQKPIAELKSRKERITRLLDVKKQAE